ncbi:MAG: BON domain-containing protein [Candidatus Didemnitutus sp.]|nr:BON domain-containing protein [Candidatus Didemnitutus sp.]
MKIFRVLSLLVFPVLPSALFASLASDLRIEEAARNCYSLRVVLSDQGPMTISALNGVVALTGTVRDLQSKVLAGETIAHLRGVARVDNGLIVLGQPLEFSDGWINHAIRRRLLVQANVRANSTGIAVDDGVVTLTGTSASQSQKEQTGFYAASIDRVRSVKNNLVVDDSGTSRPSPADNVDDASINTLVKHALSAHRLGLGNDTSIRTRDGMVMISGMVDSAQEKEDITALAREIRGVRTVVNNMRVRA